MKEGNYKGRPFGYRGAPEARVCACGGVKSTATIAMCQKCWDLQTETKLCRSCDKVKVLSQFYPRTGRKASSQCRDCYKLYRDKNKEHIAMMKALSKKPGLSKEHYENLHKLQACEICGMPQMVGRFRRLCVDHDHKTNKIRGLLCTNCNTGLGKFKDSASLLQKAARYLEERA